MSAQLVLAYSRDSDPASSKRAAGRVNATSQAGRILAEMSKWETAFGACSADADRLHTIFPQWQRSVISTRLSAMHRKGWLERDESTDPITFTLSAEGRRLARCL